MKRHVLLVLLFLVHTAPAQPPADVDRRLAADLKFLTSDECEGRGVGSKGIELAADYIERQFVNAGLKPGGPNGSYYQSFQMITAVKLGAGNRMVLKGPLGQTLTLEQGKGFTVWPLGGNGKAEAPVVFAGYGITSAEPKYDDYAGMDVAGKVVVVLSGRPRQDNPYVDVFPVTDLAAQLENAVKHKAAALLYVNRAGEALAAARPKEGERVPLPTAWVQRKLVDTMFSSTGVATLADIEKRIDADLRPRSMPLTGWSCRLQTDATVTRTAAKNVIGVLEGRGPLANETVVIGAHYDHVGYFGTISNALKKPAGFSVPGGIGGAGFPLAQLWVSAIHHGADDNASGTAAVLELARRFGALKDRQGRRLVFIAFSGEESGLVGSFYYCRRPTFPLRNTTTMVNMDMIGRFQDRLMVGGLGTGKSFPALLDRLNQKHHFKLLKENAGTAPTDNTGFYLKNIPVLWFFTGFHEQYHRPSDRLETINVPGMRRVIDLIADVVREVSTVPSRPEYAKTGGFDRSKTLWSKAAATGMLIASATAGGGVILDGVVPNTPAARAGLQKGDRILELATKKVTGLVDFLQISRTLTTGQTVVVVVARAGTSRSISLKLVNPATAYVDPHFGFHADIGKLKGGLVVDDVPATSRAAALGLKKGDRIVAVAGKRFDDLETYAGILKSLPPGANVTLTVLRGGKKQELPRPKVTTPPNAPVPGKTQAAAPIGVTPAVECVSTSPCRGFSRDRRELRHARFVCRVRSASHRCR